MTRPRKHLLFVALVAALAFVALGTLPLRNPERYRHSEHTAIALEGTDILLQRAVFDVCGRPSADSIAAQVPWIGGEPLPNSFVCGPNEAFIAER